MDRKLYPADWEVISRRIRHERAGDKCEQCAVPNGARIIRSEVHPARFVIMRPEGDAWALDGTTRERDLPDVDDYAHGKVVTVVLTVAHLDHNPANNDDANLRALCQRCHLIYDKHQHAENARKTRASKIAQALQAAGQETFL